MKHRDHAHPGFLEHVAKDVGEASNESLSNVLVDDCVQFRRLADAFEPGVDTRDEFVTQAATLVLVPPLGFSQVVFRFGLNCQLVRHDSPTILRFTSSQFEPLGPDD
jgi:hypothetical protein